MALTNDDLQAITEMMERVVAPIKSELSDLRGEVAPIKSELSDVRGDIASLEKKTQEGFDRIEAAVNAAGRDIAMIEKRLNRHEEKPHIA